MDNPGGNFIETQMASDRQSRREGTSPEDRELLGLFSWPWRHVIFSQCVT